MEKLIVAAARISLRGEVRVNEITITTTVCRLTSLLKYIFFIKLGVWYYLPRLLMLRLRRTDVEPRSKYCKGRLLNHFPQPGYRSVSSSETLELGSSYCATPPKILY